ncbi:RNA 2'-phosphotransferase [Gloeocapsa sp. PCC 73106]|uniref:RNA 2'-phosphotransferase n=1 Tax=Gloeocapsa sp. PCC 73106 TaxID=102232 RepID=UPI0002AC3FAD|nr:RNA 2'-phosphotransferase [Gloeocapsa sp. PCC 73106]ELR99198.1 RNA:NAD 2'-phosphotransferase [Gloeocapsa sp. PCC 73106]
MTQKLSKFLSLILRHQPEQIGLSLNSAGWADVEQLINLANQQGIKINRCLLEDIVKTNDKQRFSFNEDKSKIRANQGHSLSIDLGLSPQEPPEFLFHGTATRFLDSILAKGLIGMKRQYVHLSIDESTALKVGKRHGKPVILLIKAGDLYRAGFTFFLVENGVWLTESVPPNFISIR